MKIRFAAPVAIAATTVIMIGACGDDGPTTSGDGPTTLAEGDVAFAGSSGLGGQTMEITAEEQDGQVTGEARFSFGLVLDLQCANTDTDGVVILGGEVTAEEGDSAEPGDRVAVLIREGDPDGVLLWYELPLPEGEVAAESCQELVDTIADDPSADEPFADIAEGDDIETG